MKRAFWICCILFLTWGLFLAGNKGSASDRNEYGGKTITFNFSNEENNSVSLIKILLYLDNNEKKVKREVYYTEKYADKKGISKLVDFFDSDAKKSRSEIHYTDRFLSEKGFNKTIDYFDTNGEQIKKEMFKNGILIKSSGQ
ncbi:MAG: hypothetical protein AB1632_08455 [Nitrospirota bacterium]